MRVGAVLTIVLFLGSAAVRAEGPSADYDRIRRALQRESPRLVIPPVAARSAAGARQSQPPSAPRGDTVWEGLLIGAAIGGVGGYVWARNICGSNDTECFVITAPVGILGGAGIGAAIGAISDKLHKSLRVPDPEPRVPRSNP